MSLNCEGTGDVVGDESLACDEEIPMPSTPLGVSQAEAVATEPAPKSILSISTNTVAGTQSKAKNAVEPTNLPEKGKDSSETETDNDSHDNPDDHDKQDNDEMIKEKALKENERETTSRTSINNQDDDNEEDNDEEDDLGQIVAVSNIITNKLRRKIGIISSSTRKRKLTPPSLPKSFHLPTTKKMKTEIPSSHNRNNSINNKNNKPSKMPFPSILPTNNNSIQRRRNNGRLPLNKLLRENKKEPIKHNLASLPPWIASALTRNTKYVCAKWDELKLGSEIGSNVLNEYLNVVRGVDISTTTPRTKTIAAVAASTSSSSISNATGKDAEKSNNFPCGQSRKPSKKEDRTNNYTISSKSICSRESNLTPKQLLQMIETLRPLTCPPPPNSELHDLVIKHEISTYSEKTYDGIRKRIAPTKTSIVTEEEENHGKNCNISDGEEDDRDMIENGSSSSPALSSKEENSNKKRQRKGQIPWNALIRVYQLMCSQDSLEDGKTPLQRRKVHYMEYTNVVDKLRSIENEVCDLKLRMDQMKRKQKELGLSLDNELLAKK